MKTFPSFTILSRIFFLVFAFFSASDLVSKNNFILHTHGNIFQSKFSLKHLHVKVLFREILTRELLQKLPARILRLVWAFERIFLTCRILLVLPVRILTKFLTQTANIDLSVKPHRPKPQNAKPHHTNKKATFSQVALT